MIISILIVIGFILWCSICEWALHKYIMHKPHKHLMYPYKTHTLTHHLIFKSDKTYHCQKVNDKDTIPMAWWNGFLISLLSSFPFLILGIKLFLVAYMVSFWYYCVYEYIHWCMHLPKCRLIEHNIFFKRLNFHHLLHHRYMNKNYNVVFPFADLIFGTLITKSKTKR